MTYFIAVNFAAGAQPWTVTINTQSTTPPPTSNPTSTSTTTTAPESSTTSTTIAPPVVVPLPDATTALSTSANPSVVGQSVTFTATVTPAPGSGSAPLGFRSAARPQQAAEAGSISFSDDERVLAIVRWKPAGRCSRPRR